LIFYAYGRKVYVFGCLSDNFMPEPEDDFYLLARHDFAWFDDALHRPDKPLREGAYKELSIL